MFCLCTKPQSWENCFLVDVTTLINPAVPTLLCGDFNTVFDRSVDRRGSCPFDHFCESTAKLVSLFSECSVVDEWRSLHPTDHCFTWTRLDGSLALRIDLIRCPSVWLPFVSSAEIFPCPLPGLFQVLASGNLTVHSLMILIILTSYCPSGPLW